MRILEAQNTVAAATAQVVATNRALVSEFEATVAENDRLLEQLHEDKLVSFPVRLLCGTVSDAMHVL